MIQDIWFERLDEECELKTGCFLVPKPTLDLNKIFDLRMEIMNLKSKLYGIIQKYYLEDWWRYLSKKHECILPDDSPGYMIGLTRAKADKLYPTFC